MIIKDKVSVKDRLHISILKSVMMNLAVHSIATENLIIEWAAGGSQAGVGEHTGPGAAGHLD